MAHQRTSRQCCMHSALSRERARIMRIVPINLQNNPASRAALNRTARAGTLTAACLEKTLPGLWRPRLIEQLRAQDWPATELEAEANRLINSVLLKIGIKFFEEAAEHLRRKYTDHQGSGSKRKRHQRGWVERQVMETLSRLADADFNINIPGNIGGKTC